MSTPYTSQAKTDAVLITGYRLALHDILGRLNGIAIEDLSTAEKQILEIASKALETL